MSNRAVIVGAGLFGHIIRDALARAGWNALILDNAEPEAGSRPAACLMKPSWFSSMGRDKYEPSLRLLDELYGVQDIRFKLQPMRSGGRLGSATVHWCDPASVLHNRNTQEATVTQVRPSVVWLSSGEFVHCDLVVVAAGIWTERLVPSVKQVGQKGVAFLWPEAKVKEPFIWPYAPYRQLVAFNRGDGLWSSDGTAIKVQNWTLERETTSLGRCAGAVGLTTGPRALTGVRPYAKGHKPCLLEEVEPGLWVASGGAKNGTIAAGWCAHEIVRRTS